jgi:hypothetical protein
LVEQLVTTGNAATLELRCDCIIVPEDGEDEETDNIITFVEDEIRAGSF